MLNRNKLIAIVTFVIVVTALFLLYSGIFEFKAPNIKTYNGWMPILIAIAALIDSINPCAFSVLFLSIAFLFGLGTTRHKILKAGFLYIFGIFLTYTLIGLGILKVLSFFNIPNLMSKVGAGIIIFFGVIGLINEFFPKFPIKLKIPNFAYGKIAVFIEKATLPASFGLGFIVGLFEFPCTGGTYLFVLGLLHDQNNFLVGLLYLLLYNFIFVLPLLIILFISSNKNVLNSIDAIRRSKTKQARIWIALIMILLGVLIFMIQ